MYIGAAGSFLGLSFDFLPLLLTLIADFFFFFFVSEGQIFWLLFVASDMKGGALTCQIGLTPQGFKSDFTLNHGKI